MAKTLRKVLRELEPGKPIKVGAKDGSGWFYIGDNLDLEKRFDTYDARLKGMWRRTLADTKDRLTQLVTVTSTFQSYVFSQLHRRAEPDYSMEGYVAHLTECMRKAKIHAERIKTIEGMLASYTPLSVRTVVDCFESDTTFDRGYTSIVLEGLEQGAFWTSDDVEELPSMQFAYNNSSDDEFYEEEETLGA